jgi:AraC-like DNA-binding protein
MFFRNKKIKIPKSMSRKISQTNISAYFSQPISGDFYLYRSFNTLLLPRVLRKYDKCLTGICIKGEAHFTLVGLKRVIKPNEIFCFLPGHFVAIDRVSSDFEAHCGIISDTFIRDITSRFPNVMFDYLISHPTMSMTSIAMDEALRYFDLIELKIKEKYNLFQKDIVFNILYSYFLDMYNIINRNLPNLPLGKTASERIFDKFTLLAYHHLKENNPVTYYADALNITPKHLSKVVKLMKGISVKQWLDELMLHDLKQSLICTQHSIQEISDEYNFSSADAFHHFFRKHTGMSPSNYRLQTDRPVERPLISIDDLIL